MKIIIIKFKKRKGKYGNKETKTFRFKASILKLQKIRWTDLVFPFASPRPSEVLAGCTATKLQPYRLILRSATTTKEKAEASICDFKSIERTKEKAGDSI